MNSKPLTYDSLKTVILYMDPNTRFLLSTRIPSIRSTEKTVPLKIEKLVIGKHSIGVNQIVYEYQVYQVDCEDKIPYKVSGCSPLDQRWTCDIDEFGVRDCMTNRMPHNDGFVDMALYLENSPTNEGRLQKLKRKLEVEKQRYNQLINYRPKENHTNNTISFENFTKIGLFSAQKYKKENLELLENEEMVKKAIEYTNKRIMQMEKELVLFQSKANNIRPKFEIYVVKELENSEPCVIERVEYQGSIHKAGESLMKFMFAKRRNIVNITNLLSQDDNSSGFKLPRCSWVPPRQPPPQLFGRPRHWQLRQVS
uniref:Uncharacterized protein n=1 Tax=Caenorhabditis tropicalis TaxID=1561998 RepID=A0A1I7TAJ8_9PELO